GVTPPWWRSAASAFYSIPVTTERFLQRTKAKGVDLTKLDFVVLSHRHGDHIGGFTFIRNRRSGRASFIGRDPVPLRDNQVKSSGDEVNVRIDLGSFGNDGLYSRMRTANHQYDALRRVNGERQLFQFPGPRRVGYHGDQGNAGGHFRGLVDQLNVRSGKGCP